MKFPEKYLDLFKPETKAHLFLATIMPDGSAMTRITHRFSPMINEKSARGYRPVNSNATAAMNTSSEISPMPPLRATHSPVVSFHQ